MYVGDSSQTKKKKKKKKSRAFDKRQDALAKVSQDFFLKASLDQPDLFQPMSGSKRRINVFIIINL